MKMPLSISLATPFVTVEEFSRISGLPIGTCYNWIHLGKLPIRPKNGKAERVLINMLALLKEAELSTLISQ
ncbi:DNA-binding protein [Hafnia alvei]|uniref:DNA-binding protein n=1 Tax=Hafnia alvei TaxID=569 RepID=UPI00103369E1|nr:MULTISPECIES: DNA-binding protein [Hafnia]TBL90126.1 DNA-binding protein [Hafnia alvei]